MTMTNEEIVRHWRQSKRRPGDLTVLAELNQTDKASIREVLEEAGEVLPPPRKPRRTEPDQPALRPAEPPARPESAPPAIWGRIETILAAIPQDASGEVRRQAGGLLEALFREYLAKRLGSSELFAEGSEP